MTFQNKVSLSLRNTSLYEDIANACTRPILNLNWKLVKSYSIHSQVIVIFKSIILKSVNQSFFLKEPSHIHIQVIEFVTQSYSSR